MKVFVVIKVLSYGEKNRMVIECDIGFKCSFLRVKSLFEILVNFVCKGFGLKISIRCYYVMNGLSYVLCLCMVMGYIYIWLEIYFVDGRNDCCF